MKVCFPVQKNDGLASPVFNHFGSAPIFLLVDSDTGEIVEAINRDLDHAHGKCSPLAALGGKTVDTVIVGGIGGGALRGLTQAGITVLKAGDGPISENLEHLKKESLPTLEAHQVCGGHGHGHKCGQH